MSVLPVGCALNAERAFSAVGTDASIVPTATGYVKAICWGIPAMFATQALTYTCEGLGRTRPIMAMTVRAAGQRAAELVFMFGHWGAGAFGARRHRCRKCNHDVGRARSDARAREWSVVYAVRPVRARAPRRATAAAILALSLPFTGSLLAEGSLFIGATLMVALSARGSSQRTRSR
jgi:MATE family multidrug resistance protein